MNPAGPQTRSGSGSRLDPQMARLLGEQRPAPIGASLERRREAYRRERAYWNADAPALAAVREDAVSGPYGSVPLRLYYPQTGQPLPALLYLHGGGWVFGDLDTHDRIMRLLALHAGATVIGVDYRRAPEHRFPVQIEETLAVLAVAAEHGRERWRIDGGLAVGGDSAGAHIALATTLQPAAAGLLRAGLLFYGTFGLQDSASLRRYGGGDYRLSRADMDEYRDCLLPSPADAADPRYDLLGADLSAVPAQYILAAELDPLLDDSLALAGLLDDIGGEHELRVCPGVVHGFLHYSRALDRAGECLRDAGRWLAGQFAA